MIVFDSTASTRSTALAGRAGLARSVALVRSVALARRFALVRGVALARSIVLVRWIAMFVCMATFATNVYADKKPDYKSASRAVNGRWYDHKTGNYVDPALEPLRDNDLRKDGDPLEVSDSSTWFWEWIRSIGNLIGEAFILLLQSLGYIAIVTLILLLVWGIYYATGIYIRTYRPLEQIDTSKAVTIDVTRIEELPFEQMQNTSDPLGVCRALARDGKFDEAIVYLYGYQLLALDHARKIFLHKGKTNRMYLKELLEHQELRTILGITVERFELVYFGKHSLSKQEFLVAWNTLDNFHRFLNSFDQGNSNSYSAASAAAGATI